MQERTTSELIETLGEDVSRCHELLLESIDEGVIDSQGYVDADYEFAARQLIRAILAFIEGVTFSVKVKAAELCLERKRDISDAERFFATDTDFVLTSKGQVIERPAHIRLSDNIRFAFALLEKAYALPEQFDPSVDWWSCLKKSIRVRDRLTHPKLPEDIDISGQEIVDALEAYEGFKEHVLSHGEESDT